MSLEQMDWNKEVTLCVLSFIIRLWTLLFCVVRRDHEKELHICMFIHWKVKVKSLSRVWLCDPVDCSPPGSSIHGILQARILEWVAISFSRGSSPPRDWTQVSCTAGTRFNLWATREAPVYMCIDLCIDTHIYKRTKIYITTPKEKKPILLYNNLKNKVK